MKVLNLKSLYLRELNLGELNTRRLEKWDASNLSIFNLNIFNWKKTAGFTYAELMSGIAILLIGVSIFVSMYRAANINKILASERMAMATAAQNMAEVYLASKENGKEAAETEGTSQGFNVSLIESEADAEGIRTVTIIIHSRYADIYPEGHALHIEDYVLVFKALDKGALNI